MLTLRALRDQERKRADPFFLLSKEISIPDTSAFPCEVKSDLDRRELSERTTEHGQAAQLTSLAITYAARKSIATNAWIKVNIWFVFWKRRRLFGRCRRCDKIIRLI